MFLPRMKGEIHMSVIDMYIKKINEILESLSENELLYILTFVTKMFDKH